MFLAIGDNQDRVETYKNLSLSDCQYPNLVHPLANIDPTSNVGVGNFIGPFANIGPAVKIGDFNIVNSYANLEHETCLGSFCQIAPGSVILVDAN